MGIPETLAGLVVPIGSVRPYPGNPRRGDLEAIKRSLEVNGQFRPIVVNRRTGEVLAGNHTWRAAVELGWEEIAATFVDVDDEQATRIVLADNRTAELGGYDDSELAALLESLTDLGGSGWLQRDLDGLLDRLARGTDSDRDTEPAPTPDEPTAKRGDLWQLGDHRLLCGDSRDADDVARVFAGELAEMVCTDPPYGVNYHDRRGSHAKGTYYHSGKNSGVGGTAGASFANDFTDDEQLGELVHSVLTLAREHTLPGGAVYVAHPDGRAPVFRAAVDDAGWDIRQTLVWVKQVFVLTRQDYHWQHEPILYGWKPGAGHRWRGGATPATVIDDDVDPSKMDKRELVALVRKLQNERNTDVIRADRPFVAELHPTSKPVALVARMVGNSSQRGELVYDPFGGSGSTLIACENLARHARLIELEPRYCDVIVDRWQRHTGRKAKRARR